MQKINDLKVQNNRPKRLIGIKMMLFGKIIVPLITGILITCSITMLLIYIFNPIWIEKSSNQFTSNYKQFATEISETSALIFNHTFSKMSINVDMIGIHFFSLYYNQIPLFNISAISSTQICNGYDFFDGNAQISDNISSSMWFIPNEATKEITSLSNTSQNNLKIALNLDMLTYAQFDSGLGEIHAIYGGFENDALFFSHPPLNLSHVKRLGYSDSIECKGNGSEKYYINVTCLGWYSDSKLIFNEYKAANYFDEFDKFQKRINYFPSAAWDEVANCVIVTFCEMLADEKNELIGVICVEIIANDLTNYIFESYINSVPQYFYLVDPFSPSGIAISHQFYQTCDPNCYNYKAQLINLEFDLSDPEQNASALEFQKTFVHLMLDSSPHNLSTGIFHRSGRDFLITIRKVYYQWEMATSCIFSLVVVVDLNYLLENFHETELKIQNLIIDVTTLISGIVLAVIVVAIMYYLSLVRPIDILVDHAKKIEHGNFEDDILANYTLSNDELNTLFLIFQKLTFLLKFANDALKTENDSSALINYAEALKLYEDLDNKKGAGIIYNNIGNIHMKFARFKEAIVSYSKAIEICNSEINTEQKHLEFVKESILQRNHDAKAVTKKKKPLDKALDPLMENEINEIEFNIKKLKENISKRVFQLANAYMNESVSNPDIDNWDIVLKMMKEVIRIDNDLHLFTSRRITSKIIISKVFYSMEYYYEAYNYIDEAEKDLEFYEKSWENGDKFYENNDQFLNEQQRIKDTPPEILKQEIMLQKGVLLKKNGNFKEASAILTQCLETGKIYHPELRNKCLEQLKDIFESKNLLHKAPNIQKILDRNLKKNNNDIIFLLDISESMTENKEDYALREILKFFDKYMEPEDRVGFMRFNHNCHVIFTLRERGKNHVYLRKSIQNSKETVRCEGETAFFSALYEALELFKKAEKKDHLKWIIALTDGLDNCSKITYDDIYDKLKKSDVSLIMIGLGLNKESIPELIKLCRATKDGVFLESAEDSKNIEVAFQAMKKQICDSYKQTFNESLI